MKSLSTNLERFHFLNSPNATFLLASLPLMLTAAENTSWMVLLP